VESECLATPEVPILVARPLDTMFGEIAEGRRFSPISWGFVQRFSPVFRDLLVAKRWHC